MSPDVLHNLWPRWDSDPPLFHADEVHRLFGPALERLVTIGLVHETTPATCAPCWDCGDGVVEPITCVQHPKTGQRRAYIHCPECGVQEVSFELLRRWVIATEDALRVVADVARYQGGILESVANHLWRLGYFQLGQRRREVFLARAVHDGNRDDVIAVLVKHAKALLLVPTPAVAERWQGELPNIVVALEDALALSNERIVFDTSLIESRYAELEALKPRSAPSKRAVRTAKIEKLEEVLIAHLQAARDHAFTRKEQTGLPELLPRPTQFHLARMLAISKSDVSRCLRDRSARALRVYWETAADLDQIMNWPGRRRVRT